jgi:hypothetical protein
LNDPHFNSPSRPPDDYSFRVGRYPDRKIFPCNKSTMMDGAIQSTPRTP